MQQWIDNVLNYLGWWSHVIVFIGIGINSILWVLYIRRSNQGKAFQAGLFDAFLYLIGGSVIMGYNRHPLLLLTAALSAFLFTIVTVKFDHGRSKTLV